VTAVEELPPHDIEAEEACIAALLVDPDALDGMAPVVTPGDFFREHHGWIFAAAQAVRDRAEQVNQITVAHELAVRGQLADLGGHSFMADLVRRLPTSMGSEWYARIVAKCAKRRKLVSLGATLSRMAMTEDDPERVADVALDQLIRAGIDGTKPLTRTIAEVLKSGAMDELVAIMTTEERGKPLGFSTGYAQLDALIDGLVPGNFVPLLADTGMGKSYLLANIARHLALAGVATHIVSTEVTARELAHRDVWLDAGLDPHVRRFLTGFSEGDIRRAMSALGNVSEWGQRVFVVDRPGITIDTLRAEVRRVRLRHNTKVLMLDHLGHIRVPGLRNDEARELGAVSRAAKEIAVTEEMPVLAVAHVNRAAQNAGGRISYNDGKNSSAIEQEADRVLSMYAVDEFGEPMSRDAAMEWKRTHGSVQLVRIEAGKHRSGPTSAVTLRLSWPEGGRFVGMGE